MEIVLIFLKYKMKKLITAFVFILSFAFGAHLKAQDWPELDIKSNPAAPELKFEKMTHEFGKIKKNADGNCVFKFKNTGKQPLLITEAKADCGCTTPDYPKAPIMPGQSGEIKVHYDTSKTGQFTKNIIVKSNAKNATITLTIKGEVLMN